MSVDPLHVDQQAVHISEKEILSLHNPSSEISPESQSYVAMVSQGDSEGIVIQGNMLPVTEFLTSQTGSKVSVDSPSSCTFTTIPTTSTGSLPEGTVLQIAHDATILAVATLNGLGDESAVVSSSTMDSVAITAPAEVAASIADAINSIDLSNNTEESATHTLIPVPDSSSSLSVNPDSSDAEIDISTFLSGPSEHQVPIISTSSNDASHPRAENQNEGIVPDVSQMIDAELMRHQQQCASLQPMEQSQQQQQQTNIIQQALESEQQDEGSVAVSQSIQEQDSALTSTASDQPAKPGGADNGSVVVIDVSNPIQLGLNSLIVVNGQKCVLQQNPQTGQVIAYPVKEPDKPKKRRGRPRKTESQQQPSPAAEEQAPSIESAPPIEEEEEENVEKGMAEVTTEDGATVRRSRRKRKRAHTLKDYETGNWKQELGSDEDEDATFMIDEEFSSPFRKRGRSRGRGRGKRFGQAVPSLPLATIGQPAKRGRGRPRRILPSRETMQSFLIQTSDGQNLMIQLPMSSIPQGMTLQEVAQNIANSLNMASQATTSSSVPVGLANSSEADITNANVLVLEGVDKLGISAADLPAVANDVSEENLEPKTLEQSVNNDTLQVENILNGTQEHVIISNSKESNGEEQNGEITLQCLLEESQEQNNNKSTTLNDSSIDKPMPEDQSLLHVQQQFQNYSEASHKVGDAKEQKFENVHNEAFKDCDLLQACTKEIGPFVNSVNPSVGTTESNSVTGSSNADPISKDLDVFQHTSDNMVDQIVTENCTASQPLESTIGLVIQQPELEASDSKQVEELTGDDSNKGEEQQQDTLATNPLSSVMLTVQPLPVKRRPGRPRKHPLPASSTASSTTTTTTSESQVMIQNLVSNPPSSESNASASQLAVISPKGQQSSSVSDGTTLALSSSSPSGSATVIPLPEKIVPYLMNKQDAPLRITGLKAVDSELESLQCPKCGFQAYYHQLYQEHLESHGQEVQRCKCCQFLCFEKSDLVKHYQENHPRCICSICEYMGEQPYVVKRHMLRHIENKCACQICGKKYKDRYILKMHIKTVHLPADVMYDCTTCYKKFNRKAHLKRHMRTHQAERPYSCSLCDYKGCERSDVVKHMLIHQEPKHVCEVCGKTFRHVKNKELHLKRHSGQRDYKCGVCDFYGYTFTDIRKHIERKHADPKTIICERCGQAFKTESLLKEHQESNQCAVNMVEHNLSEDETTLVVSNGGNNAETNNFSHIQENTVDQIAIAPESLANTSEAGPSNVTTITLSDETMAAAFSALKGLEGHIVVSDVDGTNISISASDLLSQAGQLAIVTSKGDTSEHVALVTDSEHLSECLPQHDTGMDMPTGQNDSMANMVITSVPSLVTQNLSVCATNQENNMIHLDGTFQCQDIINNATSLQLQTDASDTTCS